MLWVALQWGRVGMLGGAAGRRRRKRMRKSSSLGDILPSDCRWEHGKWGCKVGVASHKNLIPTKEPTLLVILGAMFCVSAPQAGAQEPLVPTKPASRSHIFRAKLKLVTTICLQG